MVQYSLFTYIPDGYHRRVAKANLKQYPVNKQSAIYRLLLNREPVYVSVALFKDNNIYPTAIFYDFDCNKNQAWHEIEKLINYCDRRKLPYSVVEPRRGYHFYLHLLPTPMSSQIYHSLSDWLISQTDIEHYDDRTDGNIQQLARVPGSYYPELNKRVLIIRQKLYTFQSPFSLLDEDTLRKTNIPYYPYELQTYYRPCIDYLIQDRHPSQLVRFTWCTLRVLQGKTDEEILKEARDYHWEDFDEDYTRYQIQHIRRRGYALSSCGLLKKEGCCIPQVCKWRQHKKCP